MGGEPGQDANVLAVRGALELEEGQVLLDGPVVVGAGVVLGALLFRVGQVGEEAAVDVGAAHLGGADV